MYCVTLYLFFIRWWCNLNEFPPNLTSNLCPVKFTQFTPNLTRNLCPVKFQIRPGMKYCSIWVEIHGFTPNLSSISGLVELGIIPMNLLPFWAVFHARSNLKFDRSNSTGHEILLKLGWNSWIYTLVELGIIPMNLLPFWAVFHARSNSTGLIGSKSSWIHWDDTQFDKGGIQCNLSEFQPILSSISCPVEFDQAWNTAQNGSKFIGMIPNSTRPEILL